MRDLGNVKVLGIEKKYWKYHYFFNILTFSLLKRLMPDFSGVLMIKNELKIKKYQNYPLSGMYLQ
jgi:hypothetical protein